MKSKPRPPNARDAHADIAGLGQLLVDIIGNSPAGPIRHTGLKLRFQNLSRVFGKLSCSSVDIDNVPF
jgi:hypothetical protein